VVVSLRKLIALSPVAILAATGGASPLLDRCSPDAPGVRDVRAVADRIIAADNRRDIDRVLGFYASDAILMPPGEAPVTGRERIRPRYEQLFASFVPELRTQIDEACAQSGFGYVRGRNTGRFVPRASGEPRTVDDVFVMLLNRETDGVWRITRLIWHRQSAVPTPPKRLR
jgi:uncharacterized protein (TIGR02246 family)